MESIKQVIMRRDQISAEQADELIECAKEDLQDYLAANDIEGAENICQEHFGLESDYIFDLM